MTNRQFASNLCIKPLQSLVASIQSCTYAYIYIYTHIYISIVWQLQLPTKSNLQNRILNHSAHCACFSTFFLVQYCIYNNTVSYHIQQPDPYRCHDIIESFASHGSFPLAKNTIGDYLSSRLGMILHLAPAEGPEGPQLQSLPVVSVTLVPQTLRTPRPQSKQKKHVL